LREIYPDISLERDEQDKPIVREGPPCDGLAWRMGARAQSSLCRRSPRAHHGLSFRPDVFPVRLHLRHGGPDTILRTLYGPRTATHGIHVPIRSAADHLVEYCAAIVEADPLAPKHKFEGILDKQAIHLMGLILRIAAAVRTDQRSEFSLSRWRTCAAQSFPHEDYQKFAQELIDIIGWPEFALWAAKEDLNAGHHGTETQVEDAWFKYCDFLEHFLKVRSAFKRRNLLLAPAQLPAGPALPVHRPPPKAEMASHPLAGFYLVDVPP
jgi:hypothetical protein